MAKIGLIIAAGAGTRLADHTGIPKPLRKVAGLPLLRRIVLTSAKAGLEKIYVVVGFQKEKIIDYINKEEWPIPIETIENEHWKKSNGVSVLSAKNHIKEDFVLLMSDHVFDVDNLKCLLRQGLQDQDGVLAVDYKTREIFDEDDATKVLVKEGLIQKIGKELVNFNAIDTGMFLFSPKIFTALQNALVDGDCSLSQGVFQLTQAGKMGTCDIGDGFWQDVDNKACLKYAEKVLLNNCRKTTDGFISRNFNRHISLFISKYLMHTPLTANQATFIISVIGILSGVLAAMGSYSSILVGAILFKLTSILDGVDGELSKLKMTQSKQGAWLDTASDNLTYVVFAFGLVWGLYQRGEPTLTLFGPLALFGILMLIGLMVAFTLRSSDDGSLLAVQASFQEEASDNILVRLFSKLYFVIKRDFFATAFLVLAVFDLSQWIVISLAVAANVAWLIVLKEKFLNSSK